MSISLYRIPKRLTGILVKPFLEPYMEREPAPQMFGEKSPEALGANQAWTVALTNAVRYSRSSTSLM